MPLLDVKNKIVWSLLTALVQKAYFMKLASLRIWTFGEFFKKPSLAGCYMMLASPPNSLKCKMHFIMAM